MPASSYQILDSLPVYGDLPLQYSATGMGLYREGFVVKFITSESENWVGNFQPGLSNYYEVLRQPSSDNLIVIAGGEAYIINPISRQLVSHFGGQIELAKEISCLNAILFCNGLWFELFGENGFVWRSNRLSWDGMKNIVITNTEVSGESWCFDDTWHQFSVSLQNGSSTGGSYNGP